MCGPRVIAGLCRAIDSVAIRALGPVVSTIGGFDATLSRFGRVTEDHGDLRGRCRRTAGLAGTDPTDPGPISQLISKHAGAGAKLGPASKRSTEQCLTAWTRPSHLSRHDRTRRPPPLPSRAKSVSQRRTETLSCRLGSPAQRRSGELPPSRDAFARRDADSNRRYGSGGIGGAWILHHAVADHDTSRFERPSLVTGMPQAGGHRQTGVV